MPDQPHDNSAEPDAMPTRTGRATTWSARTQIIVATVGAGLVVAAAAVFLVDRAPADRLVEFAADSVPPEAEEPAQPEPEPVLEPEVEADEAKAPDPGVGGPEPADGEAPGEASVPDGPPAHIVGRTVDSRIVVIDTVTGDVIRTLYDRSKDPLASQEPEGSALHHDTMADSLSLSSDGSYAYVGFCCSDDAGVVYRLPTTHSDYWDAYLEGSRETFYKEAFYGFASISRSQDGDEYSASLFRSDEWQAYREAARASQLESSIRDRGVAHLVPSPDGEHYAVQLNWWDGGGAGNTGAIAIIDRDLEVLRVLGGGPSPGLDKVAWSPDGRTLAYDWINVQHPFVLDLDTADSLGDAREIAGPPGYELLNPVFDAHGRLIVTAEDKAWQLDALRDGTPADEIERTLQQLTIAPGELFTEERESSESHPLPLPPHVLGVRDRSIDRTGRYVLFVYDDWTVFWRGRDGSEGALELDIELAGAAW